MPLKKEFNAKVVYQLYSTPPSLGLYNRDLGYAEVCLGDLGLSKKEVEALVEAENVTGTYEIRTTPSNIYIVNEAMKDPANGMQKSRWKVKSIKPV